MLQQDESPTPPPRAAGAPRVPPAFAWRRWGVGQLLRVTTSSLALWAALAGTCLYFGSTKQPGWPRGEVLAFRLESVLNASLVGAALAGAGVAYQAVLRNPLADPYLLGVSSGAALAGYLWGLPALALWPGFLPFSQQAVAFAGALGALAVVFLLAQRRGRLEPVTLLLVGVIVNAVCGAAFLLVYHLNLRSDNTSQTGGPLRFLVGGINTSLTRGQELSAAGVVAAAGAVLFYLAGQLNVAALSEAEARALGVRIHRLRWVALAAASLATASAVALSGPIGFVGLVCPHLGRLVVGGDHRRLLPVAVALGAGLLAAADTASRRLSSLTSGPLPVGVLTGILGGPFFLAMLWRTRSRSQSAGAADG